MHFSTAFVLVAFQFFFQFNIYFFSNFQSHKAFILRKRHYNFPNKFLSSIICWQPKDKHNLCHQFLQYFFSFPLSCTDSHHPPFKISVPSDQPFCFSKCTHDATQALPFYAACIFKNNTCILLDRIPTCNTYPLFLSVLRLSLIAWISSLSRDCSFLFSSLTLSWDNSSSDMKLGGKDPLESLLQISIKFIQQFLI